MVDYVTTEVVKTLQNAQWQANSPIPPNFGTMGTRPVGSQAELSILNSREAQIHNHSIPFAILTDLIVLCSSMVIVMGPTPPGTGEMALAFLLTSS